MGIWIRKLAVAPGGMLTLLGVSLTFNPGLSVGPALSEISSVPIKDVTGKQKLIPLDSLIIKAGLSVGTSFGVKMT